MGRLPFLIRYGNLVWPVAGLAFVVVWVGLVGAVERRIRRRAQRRLWTRVASTLAGILIFLAVARYGGRALLAGAPLRGRTRLLVAAALPFHRDEAIRQYRSWLILRGASEDALLQRTALRLLSGDCIDAGRELFSRGQLARALAVLDGCPDSEQRRLLVAESLFALGNYATASDRFAEVPADLAPRTVLGAHIAAHRYDRALAVARRIADDSAAPRWRCFALALTARDGDARAVAALRALAIQHQDDDERVCMVLAVDADPWVGRDDVQNLPAHAVLAMLGRERAAARDALRAILPSGDPARAAMAPWERPGTLPAGWYLRALGQFQPHRGAAWELALRAELAYTLALLADGAGDEQRGSSWTDEARALIDEARATGSRSFAATESSAPVEDEVEVLLSVRRGRVDEARRRCAEFPVTACRFVADVDALLAGDSSRLPSYAREYVPGARGGDGSELAWLFNLSGQENWWAVATAFCPSLSRHRAAVREAIDWSSAANPHGEPRTPTHWFRVFRARRDAARLCGFDDLAASYEPALRAHYLALLDPTDSGLYAALEAMP